MEFPRIIIAALRGGSGKTILSIGMIAAWRKPGVRVAPFKKGPDYIDAGWLALAADRPCYNLDAFLLSESDNWRSLLTHGSGCDIAVIEGNRGLYDGIDLESSTSTARLARLISAPLILCVDCTKITGTMAAIIAGCQRFDPQVALKGVVLNRVAGSRHENKLRRSIEHYCGIPVLGAIPKLDRQDFPERHMGLVPTAEHDWARTAIDTAAGVAQEHMELDALLTIARQAPAPKAKLTPASLYPCAEIKAAVPPRIGIFKDAAFQFYYPENIEALRAAGAATIFISPLDGRRLPEIDGLYIGGGFPETHARPLAENRAFSQRLKTLVEAGLPIYAECGGLMYLGEKLVIGDTAYPMAGVLPLVFGFYKRPQAHGYTIVAVKNENPYFAIGTEIRGHEFHYSRVLQWSGDDRDLVFRMQRGAGITQNKDGLLYKNVLATYTHIHALGTPGWAPALVRNALAFKKKGPAF